MTLSVCSTAGAGTATFACSVAAYGVVEAPLAGLPALRERPGGPLSPPLPPRFLRYADEQTVVALAAVLRAIDSPPLRDECLDEWGVLAAPQFLGRAAGATTFAKFKQGALSTVSPHVIPQHSLHSVSGAVSIALGMHGPNFGVGGGPESLAEGLTAALTFLEHGAVAGLWLTLTQWLPEPTPDATGAIGGDLVCWGVALALVRGARHDGTVLRLSNGPAVRCVGPAPPVPRPHVADLARYLQRPAGSGEDAPWSCPMPWGGRVELALRTQQLLKAA